MTATYNSVSIGGNEYDVYADIATADSYLAAEFSDAATRWRDATLTDDDAKARALVSATRLIDRQVWPGTKSDGAYQTLAWPRDGTGVDDVTDGVIPQAIIDACILIAADINNGSTVVSNDSTDDRQKRLKAGSVEIEYFRDLDGAPRFPTAIQELLGPLLAGSGPAVAGSLSYGTDTCTRFSDDYVPVQPG